MCLNHRLRVSHPGALATRIVSFFICLSSSAPSFVASWVIFPPTIEKGAFRPLLHFLVPPRLFGAFNPPSAVAFFVPVRLKLLRFFGFGMSSFSF